MDDDFVCQQCGKTPAYEQWAPDDDKHMGESAVLCEECYEDALQDWYCDREAAGDGEARMGITQEPQP